MSWVWWIVLQWRYRCMCLFQGRFCLDICPRVGLLGHMVVLYLVFWGTSIIFSIVVVPIYIPTNIVGGFPFLHMLSSICYLWTYLWWPFRLVWGGYLMVGLICISIIISDVEHFLCACWPSVCLLCRNVYLGLQPIFRLGHLFLCVWVVWVCIFWRLSPYSYIICNYFLPFCRSSFHFFNGFLCCAKACKFN